MRRILVTAAIMFATVTGILCGFLIVKDRRDELRRVEELTSSLARMVMAHGDATLDTAENTLVSIVPSVEHWDLLDKPQGYELYQRLRELIGASGQQSSAWLTDGNGIGVLETTDYPSKRLNTADGAYFKAHLAGAAEPVILGDSLADINTGKRRFTYSRALRNPGGALRAVMVIGIYESNFQTLYREAANRPGAWAGLQTLKGIPLARYDGKAPAPEAFLQEISNRASAASSGSAIVELASGTRIFSWQRSLNHPQVFASSSQSVSDALRDWRFRSVFIGGLTVVANLAFLAFTLLAFRANQAQQAAQANALAIREVHHRLKNSLQMISSLVRMRSSKYRDPDLREAVDDITSDLKAVAETYSFMQKASSVEMVDAVSIVEMLCRHVQKSPGKTVHFTAANSHPVMIHTHHATTLTVIVNEIVTNAIRHGEGQVTVTVFDNNDALQIKVTNGGRMLSEGFSIENTEGFGLRAVRAMVKALEGTLSVESLSAGGAVFVVELPLQPLKSG